MTDETMINPVQDSPVITTATRSPHSAPNLPFREWKIIVNGTRLQDQTALAEDALADVNSPPFVFKWARGLVRIAFDENGNPAIAPLSEAGVRGIIERCASFVRTMKDGSEIPTAPPIDVIKDYIALPKWRAMPSIAGIIESPLILPDSTIVTKEGYDPGTRLYFAPAPGFVLPEIPEKPTEDDVAGAVALVSEVFQDFPFVDASSKANTFGMLLSTVIRPLIKGPVPLAILDKNQAGVGASLIAGVIALIATGRPGAVMPAPEDDSEWRKMITATLSQGRTVAVVDNLESKLYAPSFAALLTCEVWEDRILGKTEKIFLKHSLVWIATGNNIQLAGDLPRRCYWIRMDTHTARPWQRTDYKHPDLLAWVARERNQILAALLTMTRAWILAGRPKPEDAVPRIGSFEGWRDTIGGILNYCKVPGFLGNMEQMYLMADADTPQWEAFLEKWYSIWPNVGKTVGSITKHMKSEDTSSSIEYAGTDRLVDHLPDGLADAWTGKKSFTRVFGNSLSKRNGRIFTNDLQLQKGDISHNAAIWKVVKILKVVEPTEKGELAKTANSDVKGELRGVPLTSMCEEDKNIVYSNGGRKTPQNSPSDVDSKNTNSPVPVQNSYYGMTRAQLTEIQELHHPKVPPHPDDFQAAWRAASSQPYSPQLECIKRCGREMFEECQGADRHYPKCSEGGK